MLKALLEADVDLAPKPAKPEKTFFFACQKGKRYQDQILTHISQHCSNFEFLSKLTIQQCWPQSSYSSK